MYFNMPKKFSDNVPTDAVPPPKDMDKTDEDGHFNNEEFKVIPELKVDMDALVYTHSQVNMMGYLGSWMEHHSWDGLKVKRTRWQSFFEGFGDTFFATVRSNKTCC